MDDERPDEPMDDEQKRRIAAQSWKRGNDSVSKEDFKFAVEMYRQSVNLCPDNVLYRQSLRGAQYKLYKNNKTGKGGMFTKGTITKLRAQCKTSRMRSRWDELDKTAEDGLAINPWDGGFNADAGEACYQRGFLDTAAELFKLAVQADPKNVDHVRALANVQEERGNNIDASKLWDMVYRLDPTDGDARRRSQDNITKDTMKDGYDNAESTRDVGGKPKDAYDEGRPATPRGGREDKDELSDEEQLQRQVRKNPESVADRLKLAEYYKSAKDWESARDVFEQALELSGGDVNIREHVEDSEIQLLRRNLELAGKKAQESGDPKDKKLAERVEREFVLREMEVLRSRIERYPNDSKFKYELGVRQMRFQNFKDAIPLLQQCVTDKRRQADVLLRLGKCFIGVENEGIAKRQFAKAIEVLNPIDQPESFCEAHYFSGRMAEKAGDRAAAEHHYNEILSVNFGYKDVQRRIDGLDDDTNGSAGTSSP